MDAWEEDSIDSWESEGWNFDDREVWFWDDLNIELIESGNAENKESNSGANVDWISNDLPPSAPRTYAVETVEKVVWPNFPITEANWNGKRWLYEDGEPVAVARWK